jgi:large subunit ribosomal protein L18
VFVQKCGRRGEMDKEDYGYAWDDHEMGYGREEEIPHLGKRRAKPEKEKKNHGKKSFKLRTEKCLRPFTLDVFLSGKYIHASVMHRVTSKVVAVVSTNAKEFRNQLKSYKDFSACKVVGETLAVRAKEADVFTVVYEPRKGEKFEGRLAAVVHTFEDHGINVDMD